MTAASTSPSASNAEADGCYNRRRTAINFIAISGSGALSMLVGVLISIYVRRVLGPVAIGQVTWNIALLSYLSLFVANPGLQTIGQREVAKNPAATAMLTSSILVVGMLLAVATYAVVLLIALIEPRGPRVSTLLVLQGLNIFVLACNLEWVLRAHEHMVAPAIASLVVNTLQLPVLLLFVHGPDDVVFYAVCGIPFVLLTVAYNGWYLQHRRLLSLRQLRLTLAGARMLLGESWPVVLSQAGVLIYWSSGAVILGFTDGDEAVGLYGTAARLIFMATIASGGMLNAYSPVLARVHDDPEKAAQVAREFTTLLAWMGLPLSVLGWAFGGHFVDMMYGPLFHEGGRYFEWLCLSIGLSFVNIGLGKPLTAWGYQKTELKINAIGAAANLAVSLAFIPLYGPWGAVAATIAAQLVVLAVQILVRRRIGLGWHPVLPVLLPPLACSLVVACIFMSTSAGSSHYWWAAMLLGALVLVGCFFALERRMTGIRLNLLRRA